MKIAEYLTLLTAQVHRVAKKFMEIELRAIFIHCYGHKTNLSSGDGIKGCQILEDALAYVNEAII